MKKVSLTTENSFLPLNNKTFITECCDCGLMHLWKATEKEGQLGFEISLAGLRQKARKRERNDSKNEKL